MTSSISSGSYHVWIERMYNKQTNKQTNQIYVSAATYKLSENIKTWF